jgi:hypothetical protein
VLGSGRTYGTTRDCSVGGASYALLVPPVESAAKMTCDDIVLQPTAILTAISDVRADQ